MSGPPLDASGVLTLKLLYFLASQRPSIREKMGDRRLDDARQLARDNEMLINASELGTIRQKISLLRDLKMGLESKRGLSRILQARKYHKAAKETLKFVKMASDQARDAILGSRPTQIDSQTTRTRRILGAEMKPKCATLVERMYNFKTSQGQDSEHQAGRDPYRHPVIQQAIEATWFRNKYDVGVVDHEHFFPMPIWNIALTLTVIQWCIDEWSSGTRRDSNWDIMFPTVYDSHVSLLLDFQVQSPASNGDVLYQLQCDLSRKAR